MPDVNSNALVVGGVALLSLVSAQANAQSQTYTDQSAFNAATSNRTTIDFNVDPEGKNDYRRATYTSSGTIFSDTDIFTASSTYGGFAAGTAYGSGYLEWQDSSPLLLTITLPSAATAVAFDFMELRGYTTSATFTINGSPYSYNTASTPTFFGYTSSTPFTSLALSFGSQATNNYPAYATIDNFTFGTFLPAAAAPEPGTWAMMIVGFGLAGYALRRRVRASEVKFDAKIKRIAAGGVA